MTRIRPIAVFVFLLTSATVFAQLNFDSILAAKPILRKVSEQKNKYHLQIIYTQIDRSDTGIIFRDYSYNVWPGNYFYCASLVKLPASVLALKKLNEWGIDPNSIMYTDSVNACQQKLSRDTTSASGFPSISHYIKKMLLVSDNDAYNRVFEFLGTEYIHENLAWMNFPHIKILSRYESICQPNDNLLTNPIKLLDSNLKVIYKQAPMPVRNEWKGQNRNILVGKAYRDWNNKLIEGPKDFSEMNDMSLEDAHRFLKELLYGQSKDLGIKNDQVKFLVQQLTLYPEQSISPKYNKKQYPDNYKKFLYYGDYKESIIDSNLVVTNYIGQSYGFTSDCARFKDNKNKIEFMLSAALYTNENEVINDGIYEYKSIALPFLAELGRQVYRFELKRKTKH